MTCHLMSDAFECKRTTKVKNHISADVVAFCTMNLIIDESNTRVEFASCLSVDELDIRALNSRAAVHLRRRGAGCNDGLLEARNVTEFADRWLRGNVSSHVDCAFTIDGDVVVALAYGCPW